jgi:5'-nucleotidase/UDP-sugar diphosphatase
MRIIPILTITLWCFAVAGSLGAAEPMHLIVLHTNDIHGGIEASEATFMNPEFPPALGGAASAANIIRKFREKAAKEDMGFLLVDCGDIWQGTLIGTRTGGRAVVEYINTIGYDAVVIGNHEFDISRKTLEDSCFAYAKFPFISCNIYDSTATGVKLYVKPYILKETGGLKIGVIGVTTTGTPRMSFAENIRGLYFAPEIPQVQAYIDTVRAMGVDLVFIASHLGLPYDRLAAWHELEKWAKEGFTSGYARNAMELARRIHGADAILCGDIHVGYQEPWVDPVTHIPCFQGYARGTSIDAIQFDIDPPTKTIIDWKSSADEGVLLTLFADEFPREPDIAAKIDPEVARVEKGFDEPIGETLVNLSRIGEGESLMGNLVCDAMRWKLKGDVAFTNRGGIRADIAPGYITPRDVFTVLPFDNHLVAVQLTGAFLKELFEDKLVYGGSGLFVSGMQVVVDRSKPPGHRIIVFKIDGEDMKLEKLYRVITIDYLLEGNSGMTKLAPYYSEAGAETGILMRDAVSEYIHAHSPLSPQLDGRWKYVN